MFGDLHRKAEAGVTCADGVNDRDTHRCHRHGSARHLLVGSEGTYASHGTNRVGMCWPLFFQSIMALFES